MGRTTGRSDAEPSVRGDALARVPQDVSLLVIGPSGEARGAALLARALAAMEADSHARVLFCVPARGRLQGLEAQFAALAGGRPGFGARMTLTTLADEAEELHGYVGGRSPVMAPPELVRDIVLSGFLDGGGLPLPADRLMAEWEQVIDPLRIATASAYCAAPQAAGHEPLGESERRLLWPAFDRARTVFEARMQLTAGALFERMATYFAEATDKPYSQVILDGADALPPDALRFAASLVADDAPGLTVAVDDGAEGTVRRLSRAFGLGGFAATRRLAQPSDLRSR